MAEYVAAKTGKITAAIWRLNNEGAEVKIPGPGEDLRVPVGVELKINKDEKPRSLLIEGSTGEGAELLIGAATLKADKKILVFTAGSTIGGASGMTLISTSTETAKVELGGKEVKGELKANSGKYIQTEAVKAAGLIQVKGSATWETNGQALTGALLDAKETATFNANGSTIKAAGIAVASTVTLTDNASTVWEPTAVGENFDLGSHTYAGTWKLIGNQLLEGSNTFAKLQINNKGAVAGKGVRFKEGVTQTVTELTTNGTEAEPARLESNVSAKAAKLKVKEEQLESWVIVKDITFETGVFYIPKPTSGTANAGGNSIVKPAEGFTVAFEVKPAAEVKTFAATATVGVRPTATDKMIAATKAVVTAGSTATAQDQRALTAAATATISTGVKVTDAMIAAFQASTGITISPHAHFRLETIGGKKVLILVLDE